jgi:hypothetical protein
VKGPFKEMERVIFQNRFNVGANILRAGVEIDRIPAKTWWDDDRYIMIDRDGEAVLQIERDEEWVDSQSYGPIEGLEIREDCPACGGRGCVYCED